MTEMRLRVRHMHGREVRASPRKMVCTVLMRKPTRFLSAYGIGLFIYAVQEARRLVRLSTNSHHPPGLLQPAVKCRGREYLRIIYGPDYTSDANLSRLRRRGLGAKRSLALREFALGIEALERFVRREPLRRVHECVFGVLALESEPVDPRL